MNKINFLKILRKGDLKYKYFNFLVNCCRVKDRKYNKNCFFK